ncbi:MAG: YhjD/YihY/BrkB family envelope integrity protein, partial [Candidatus Paceibacterota bacterium]
ALYGSLGLIPLFLFWIYVSWLIMLFGLELTYTLQVMHGRVPEPAEEPQMELPGDPAWLIPILADIGRAFHKGETVGRQQLSERLGLPTRVVNEYGSQLQKAGVIHCLEATLGGDVSYTLARPPEQIAVAEVLELGRQLSMRQHEPAFDVDWVYLDKLHEAELVAAGDATIASLIEDVNGQPR